MKSRSLYVVLVISAAQASQDFELAQAMQQNLKWIRPPNLTQGMPPLDMASFFAQESHYSPEINDRHQKDRHEELILPDHIKDRFELEEFGMLYGQGRQPNNWDHDEFENDRHSYEERARWYDDPYRPSYHKDYHPVDQLDYHSRSHLFPRYRYNLATNEEPSQFEDTLY